MKPVALRRVLLAGIVAGYLILGALFAISTPAWQAPDEPAHYNYVRHLVATGRFPILQPGDYPHAYLEELKRLGFPPEMSIDPIRYEFHQPPLYYVLASPVYVLGEGALLPIRLFSVILGVGILLSAYAIARLLLPGQPEIALAATALVAFLPQHLATVSQVGNDVLAELLVALVLLVLVIWSEIPVRGMQPAAQARTTDLWTKIPDRGLQIGLGLLLGLVLITKTTAYIVLPVALGAVLWRWLSKIPDRGTKIPDRGAPPARASSHRIVRDLAAIGLPAILIALPWYARNIAVYGWPDVLGLLRHDAVVVGQLRTEEFLAQNGAAEYLERLSEFTFKSFWGVFGWLGVFMDSRAYFLVALLSGVAAGGLVLRIADRGLRIGDSIADQSTIRNRKSAIVLLTISALLTLLTYAWYNTQFVQHQGRYLFTALIPIALAFALGWEAALWPRAGRILAAVLIGFAVALAAWGVLSHTGLPKWPIMITVVLAAGLFLASWLPRKLQPVLFATPYALLVLLDLYALFKAIGPQLAR